MRGSAGIRNHNNGYRAGGAIFEKKPVLRQIQRVGFYAKEIILIWLRVGPPVGTAGDGDRDDVLVAIRLAGSELHKHRLVRLRSATIVVVLAATQLHQKNTSYVAEKLSHDGSGKVLHI